MGMDMAWQWMAQAGDKPLGNPRARKASGPRTVDHGLCPEVGFYASGYQRIYSEEERIARGYA